MSEQFLFGPYSFEPASGTLSRQGILVRLQPQPARVLAILIERGGEVVSREQLRQQIWPEGTYVDFERGLNFSIARIRAALKDAADHPHYIETLPKRGYRFIAPVMRQSPDQTQAASVPEASATSELRPEPTFEAGRRPWQTRVALAAVAAVLLAFGVVAWYVPESSMPIVAVVSFDNETGQDAYDEVAISIADQTVARLATPERMKRLQVVGNAAALRKPRAFRDVKAVGEAVKAKYVVLAQMKIDPERVRVIAHLIRVSDETHVWADSFDRDAFTLDTQMDIAEAIAHAVVARVDADMKGTNR